MIVIGIGMVGGRARKKLNLRARTRVLPSLWYVMKATNFFFNLATCLNGTSVRYVFDLYILLK